MVQGAGSAACTGPSGRGRQSQTQRTSVSGGASAATGSSSGVTAGTTRWATGAPPRLRFGNCTQTPAMNAATIVTLLQGLKIML
jgi:hypothetical protein